MTPTPEKTIVTVSKSAFSIVRNVSSSSAGKSFETLMLLLQGQKVEASVYTPIINVVGYTNEKQLRECYSLLTSEEKRLWCTPTDLDNVISRFGDGKLGFNLSGILSK